MPLSESELILNSDGSIYHLNLLPEDIADTIITVGDPDRVCMVSRYFDSIEIRKGKREFLAHTGHFQGKRLTVISTGIGTDNIDIVLNELDALANINFKIREVKAIKKQLHIIRIGTSGAVQPDIEVDSFLLSESAIGVDGLLHFYHNEDAQNQALKTAFGAFIHANGQQLVPYAINADSRLASFFKKNRIRFGITLTNAGFYGPQGRNLRLESSFSNIYSNLKDFRFNDSYITNLEMETAGIYGLSKLLGHRAVSLNAILANRATGGFSKNPQKTIEGLIEYVLNTLATK